MNRGIERLAARVRRGRPTNEAETDHRARLLALCEGVQSATHAWSVFNDEPLCVNAAGLDYLWRALLVMVRDLPPGKDDAVYRYVLEMENLEAIAKLTLQHAAVGRAARQAQPD